VNEIIEGKGVRIVDLGSARFALAPAAEAPAGLSAQELAVCAGDWAGREVGRPLPVLYARQEHTALLYSFGKERTLRPGPHLVGICDGLLTAERGVALTVRTADCLPVGLAGADVVALLHAGWRGLAADIVGAAVRRLWAEYGAAAKELEAVVGVGIGPCHYEVGPEVVDALARREVVGAPWRRERAVDLAAWARGRLEALGVPANAITVVPGCTACTPDYHSFRRDGLSAGRQWSAAVLR
jgi:YfiH family protein